MRYDYLLDIIDKIHPITIMEIGGLTVIHLKK